jgi:hypothetical protein
MTGADPNKTNARNLGHLLRQARVGQIGHFRKR